MRFGQTGAAPALLRDAHVLERFENELDPGRLTAGPFRISIVGHGQLSVVFALDELPGLALKRLPPFPTPERCAYHQRAIDAYRYVLADQLGAAVVAQQCVRLRNRRGEHILYVVQERQPAESLAPALLRRCTDETAAVVVRALLGVIARIWHRNEIDAPHMSTGIDARPANWFLRLGEGGALEPLYVDTSTPFFRRGGVEMPNADIFLKRVPPAGLPLVSAAFHERIGQYYDLRHALLDFAAGFYDDGLEERLPLVLGILNEMIAAELEDFWLEQISLKETAAHHRAERRFWRRYRRISRMHRALTHAVGGRYPFILPPREPLAAPGA